MVLLVKLFSIAVIVCGCFLIFRPGTIRTIFSRVKEKNNFYIVSAVKSVIGIILMIAAGDCRVPWVIMFVGALALFSGILAFVVKRSFITGMLDWIDKQPPRFTYYIGAIALLLGVILALAA